MTTYALHPLCELFPPLTGADFDALRDDIAASGQREPIRLYEGKILDGANRYRACVELGIEPRVEGWSGTDPAAFVLSANMHRRHMTSSECSASVSGVADWRRANRWGGDRKTPRVAPGQEHKPTLNTTADHVIDQMVTDQGAHVHLDSVSDRVAISGASPRTQKMTDKIARTDPELNARIARGEVSVRQATRILEAKQPKPKAQKPKIEEPPRELEDGEPAPYTEAEKLQNALADLQVAHERIAELEAEVDAYRIGADENSAAKRIMELNGKITTLTVARDMFLDQVGQRNREIKMLRRKLGM